MEAVYHFWLSHSGLNNKDKSDWLLLLVYFPNQFKKKEKKTGDATEEEKFNTTQNPQNYIQDMNVLQEF